MSERKQVAVAAAVIFRDGPRGREFLLGQRAPGTFYPGYWEFPGGKVEPGESPVDALKRELDEELGIRVLDCSPWLTLSHVYEHAHVRLHFFRVEVVERRAARPCTQRAELAAGRRADGRTDAAGQRPGAQITAPARPHGRHACLADRPRGAA
jgi:mutator protein MutT